METVEQRLNKLREERIAREKARIDKLRELNLKKYNNNDAQSISRTPSTLSVANKTLNTDRKPKIDLHKSNLKCNSSQLKNNSSVTAVNGPKRPFTGPIPTQQSKLATRKENPIQKSVSEVKNALSSLKVPEKTIAELKNLQKIPVRSITKHTEKKDFISSNKIIHKPVNKDKLPVNAPKNTLSRKSLAPIKLTSQPKQSQLLESQSKLPEKKEGSRKSMLPVRPVSVTKNRESVFDRLYKPKTVQKAPISDADRLQRDPLFLQKVLQQGSLIANKRHTIFANVSKPVVARPVRRSISAVHFKRISKKELGNCIQKWSSIGEKLNEVHITNTNEDDRVNQDTITSAVKSERKRVRLQTPISFTPRPEELQSRLQKWLQSRGKSIDSYQHLQCFGIHHLAEKPMRPLFLKPEQPLLLKPMNEEYDDENKENIALEHDSDNDSYTEMNEQTFDDKKWRGRVSYISDSVCMNDSDHDTTLNSDEAPVDDVLLGALKDLTDLLREGFDWEQCARWLRAIRSRFPHASSLAAYWECRAALEDMRGDLPASVQCWEQAIATGTQRSVVEANLDLLLDKFMQLKISPRGGSRAADPKLVDVRNVFKSTIIRFAVQQARLRQSNQSDQPTYIMTPVRRSGRISSKWSTKTQRTPVPKTPKTPLQICSSVRQAGLMGEKVLFVPNATLCNTP